MNVGFSNLTERTRQLNALNYDWNKLSEDGRASYRRFNGLYPVFSLSDIPDVEKYVGFIYRITDRLTGKLYIGMKALGRATKRSATLKEKAAAKALNPRSNISVVRGRKESDWLTYWGSSRELQQDVLDLGVKRFVREIIDLCCTKKYQSYAELEQMFKHDVLRRDSYNGNMLSKFYRRDLLNCPEEETNSTT